MSLAQRVRDYRYAKGWGPDELASRASISRTALYQIESGRTEHPRAATVRRIAEALNITTETLLGPNLGVVGVAGWPDLESHHGPGSLVVAPVSPYGSRADLDGLSSSMRVRFDASASSYRDRERELDRKFHEILASPIGEGFARIIEDAHHFLPRSLAESGR